MNKYKKILVKYKNKIYTVINPGDYLYDSKGYLLDQLDENLPRMGRYRSVYLSKTYNLTEKDYYIILFCDGREENLPICQLDGCNNYRQFNHLLPTKRIPILSKGCCENHTRKINGILEQKYFKDNGIKISYSTDSKKTEEFRENARQRALKQVENGTHPWLLKNSTELRKRLIDEGKNPIVNMWKALDGLKNNSLDIYNPDKMKDVNYVLFSERESFKNRENITDQCYLYVAFLDNDRFKIGATKNLDNRANKNRYHKMKYQKPKIIFTSTRDIIADLEYDIKLKFIKRVALGTETFYMKDYKEIMDYIKNKIKDLPGTINNSTTGY